MSIPLTSQVVFLLALASGATAHAAAAYTWTEILVPNAMGVTAYGPKDLGEVALTNSNGSTGIYRYGRFQLRRTLSTMSALSLASRLRPRIPTTQSDSCLRELILKRQTARARQSHIEHETALEIRRIALQELLRRGE